MMDRQQIIQPSCHTLMDALIVSFSLSTWDGPRMSRHQIMSRLARTNHVLFVEPPRPIQLSEITFQIKSVTDWQTENLGIYTFPWWQGRMHRPYWLRRLLHAARLRDIRNTIMRLQQFWPVIIYIWHPNFWQYAQVFEPAVVCYHMYDDYESYLGAQGQSRRETLRRQEDFLLQHADVCFAVTPELAAKKQQSKKIIPIANGVEYDVFERAGLSSTPVPQPLLSLKGPIIGYIGTIGSKVDFSLLVDICQQRPDWSLVMIGRVNRGISDHPAYQQLRAQPNAFFMGAQLYQALPNWLKGINVCLMPYRSDSHMRYGYPLKMLEYFAAGKPVVSIDIPAVQPYTYALRVASAPAEWIRHIEAYITHDSQTESRIRQRIAQENTWERRVDEISRHLLVRIHERSRGTVHKSPRLALVQ